MYCLLLPCGGWFVVAMSVYEYVVVFVIFTIMIIIVNSVITLIQLIMIMNIRIIMFTNMFIE